MKFHSIHMGVASWTWVTRHSLEKNACIQKWYDLYLCHISFPFSRCDQLLILISITLSRSSRKLLKPLDSVSRRKHTKGVFPDRVTASRTEAQLLDGITAFDFISFLSIINRCRANIMQFSASNTDDNRDRFNKSCCRVVRQA